MYEPGLGAHDCRNEVAAAAATAAGTSHCFRRTTASRTSNVLIAPGQMVSFIQARFRSDLPALARGRELPWQRHFEGGSGLFG